MASTIRIKRSSVAGNPSTLAAGELAYSALTDNGSNGGDRLYVGIGTETAGNAANHIVIGGKYFTDMLDQTPGVLTASSAIVVDSSKKIDDLLVDNIELNGNTISTTNTNGNLILSPNGTGKVSINSSYTLPSADGTSGQVLVTNGTGTLSFSSVSTSLGIAGDTGTDTVSLLSDTLTFVGGIGLTSAVTNNTVTINGDLATTSSVGVASFNTASFAVTSGDVTIKSGGVSNTQLANSSITIGSNTVALGATQTSLAGLTELTVDNIDINGNVISSTNINGDISLDPNGTGNVDVNGAKITNVATPVAGTDAANKTYVDNAVTGLTWKDAVNLLATSNIPLTGNTSTVTIDGHATLTSTHSGYRLLLTNQTTGSQNGIYLYTDNGTTYTLTRSTDADVYTELKGASVFVLEGSLYANTGWVQSNHYITDFSAQSWTQFSGGGSYSAGDGLGQTGTTFFVKTSATGGLEIAADELQIKSTTAGAGLTITSGVLAVGGTSNRISVSADAVDIDAAYVGQTSITTLGTVSTGTWSATAIGPTKGGTGLTTYATGDILYASASNTLSKLTAGTTGQVLQINGSGVPAWTDIDGGTY